MTRLLLLIGILLHIGLLQAQSTVHTLPRPVIGLTGGYQTGSVHLKNFTASDGYFDDSQSPVIGGYLRFAVAKQCFLQVEYNHWSRTINGRLNDLVYGIYPIQLEQTGNDGSLIFQYEIFKKAKKIMPYFGAGFGLGFMDPQILRVNTVIGGVFLSPLDFKFNSNETHGISEIGAIWHIASKLRLSVSGRYYFVGNNVNFNIAPSTYLSHSGRFNRIQGHLSLGYSF